MLGIEAMIHVVVDQRPLGVHHGLLDRLMSIGIQTGPPIGVQKGPLWRCGEQARGGVASQLAQPTRACVSRAVRLVF